MEEEYEYKDGKKKLTKKKIYPGYVMVEMLMDDDSWYVVRNTPGVTGFVGPGSRPLPLQQREVDLILRQMGVEEPRPKVDFSIGEPVRVIRGPFENFSGVIEEISPERGKLRVLVSMFGRETPVELEYNQVEKLLAGQPLSLRAKRYFSTSGVGTSKTLFRLILEEVKENGKSHSPD